MIHTTLGQSLRAGLGAALLCASLAGPAAWTSARAAGESALLTPHRAVYELTLSASRGGAGVSSVAGRMVYDLVGSACEGYTQNMRFVTRMVHQSGSTTVSDLRSTTWEDAVGKRFHFDSSQFRDDKSTEATTGDAARLDAAEGIKVDLTKPAKRTISLSSGAYFPIQHTMALIHAAKGGKASFRADLYDGSEKGEKVYDTVTALGRTQAPGGNRKLPEVTGSERLNAVQAWPVSIAYFEPRSDSTDALPVYEISFLMYENGVSRKLHIDYGDFALEGDLTEIAFHEPSKCDQK
jgi:envelope integrity protein B